MTKKSMNKLLSVVLALAICFTTVFGCLITAGAADTNCCAKWSVGSASRDLDKATIYLAFTAVDEVADEGFSAIKFALDCHADLSLQSIKAVATADGFASTALVDGSAVDVNDLAFEISSDKKGVIVESENSKAYSTMVLEFTYGFVGGTAEQGATYDVSVKEIELGGDFAIHECDTVATGSIKATCDHVIAVKGDPINTDTINGYTVYENSYCTLCGEKFGYQLVPSTEPMNDTTIAWSAEGAYDDDLIDDADGEQDGSAEHPIIINSVEELYYLATKAGIDATANNYYKLADGIDNVVLQSEKAASDIMNLKTAAEVNTYFAENGGYKWDSTVSQDTAGGKTVTFAFAGNFDGNGATFYGLYDAVPQGSTDAAGLFPYVYVLDNGNTSVNAQTDKTITISNVNIKNSHLTGTYGMGFIIGKSIARANEHYNWTATVKNCTVVNNYMHSSSSGVTGIRNNGIVAGTLSSYSPTSTVTWAGKASVRVDNCLIYGNNNTTVSNYTQGIAVAGVPHNDASYGGVKNSVILGATPYTSPGDATSAHGFPSNSSHSSLFTNVYTDAPAKVEYYNQVNDYAAGNYQTITRADDGTVTYGDAVNSGTPGCITQITAADALGYNAVTACPNLDWGGIWSYGADGEYPSIVSGTPSVIYWDGTNTEVPTKTDDNGTYIIENAEQFAYIVSGAKAADTTGKNYKFADGIDTIILQPYDVILKAGGVEKLMSLSTPEEVNTFFNQEGIEFKNWFLASDISISSGAPAVFNGNFDGNGVEVYGLYGDGSSNVANANIGLFLGVGGGKADANGEDNVGVVIENVSLINSYIDNARRVGAIVGGCFAGNYGAGVKGTVTLNNCGVINNYIRATYTGMEAGVVFGANSTQVVHINNALVYGNYGMFVDTDANNAETALSLFNGSDSSRFKRNADGSITYKEDGQTVDESVCPRICASVSNSVVLGTNPFASVKNYANNDVDKSYVYVYTDQNITGKFYGTNNDDRVKVLATADDAIGTQAKDNMPKLDWKNDWYTNIGGYPTLVALDETSVATTSNGAFGLVAYNTSYKDDGSFDFNFYVEGQEGYDYVLYVGKTDNSGYTSFLKLEANDVTNPEIIAELGENAKVFSIGNLSSRDINTIWVPTIVATNGAVTEWGKSHQIALAQYAESVLNGEAIYADGTEESIKIADKKVAAALLNYADAATKALYAENDVVNKSKTKYWSGDVGTETISTLADSNDGSGDGSSWDQAIIIDNAEELFFLCRKSTWNQTQRRYYKVADDIKSFVLQDKDVVDANYLMSLTDAEEIKTYLAGLDTERLDWSKSNGSFGGNFDGNGATIYGMYCENNSGLFGGISCGIKDENNYYERITAKTVDEEVQLTTTRYYTDDIGTVIKNVNVKNSYMKTGWRLGGIVAYTNGSGYAADISGVINIDNCVVANSYFTNTDKNIQNKGIFVGAMGAVDIYDITDCMAYGNVAYMTTNGTDYANKTLYVAGTACDRWYPNADHTLSYNDPANNNYNITSTRNVNKVNNCVLIDCMPHNGNVSWANSSTSSMNYVYCNLPAAKLAHISSTDFQHTDEDVAIIEDTTDLLGFAAKTTAPALDWESGWMINNNAYPTPVQSGYIANEGKTLYWDGKKNSDTVLDDEQHSYSTQDGTAENPIIIDSAEELAYIASAGPTVSQFYNAEGTTAATLFTGPKHFKIADGIDKIVLQNSKYSDILNLSSLEETRKYFAGETGVTGFTTWAGVVGWQGASTASYPLEKRDSFCGVFDGNGVEIYGIYMNTTGYGALFGDMDGESAVKNVTVKNSYIHVSAAGYDARVAAIVAHCDKAIATSNQDYAVETITIENCKVENCHMATPDLEDPKVNSPGQYSRGKINCGLLVANLSESKLNVNNCIVVNSEAYYDYDETKVKSNLIASIYSNSSNYKLSNSIIVGTNPGANNFNATDISFTNVYTDQATSYSTVTTVDNVNELKGSKAADIVSALNAANDKEVWYVGTVGDYPGFSKADALPSAYKAEYDALVPDQFNVSPTGGTENFGFYANSVNLRANPYLTFIFNFGEDYKTNRDDITVTFTYTVGGDQKTKTVSVPAYEEGKDLKADGWSNLAKSKKHTYQFTDLPIQGLVNGVSVVINYGDESVDCGTYSAKGAANAFTNANKKTPCSYYEVCAEAMKALVYYSQALTARYGN